MARKIPSIIIIILILALIGSTPFLGRILPNEIIDLIGPIGIVGLVGVIVVILVIILILINKLGKGPRLSKEEKLKLKEEAKLKKQKAKEEKQNKKNVEKIRPSKKPVENKVENKNTEKDLKEKRNELVLELKEAERQFLKHKIDKLTFDTLSKEKNAELIQIEASLDAQKKVNLSRDNVKILEKISKDKKDVLQGLLIAKQKKVHELQIAEKSFYKRKIDESTFKKISNQIKTEIISIDSKIKAIQKSDQIEKIKAELKNGAKEISQQKQNTQKRIDANESFEEDIFSQIDQMVDGFKR